MERGRERSRIAPEEEEELWPYPELPLKCDEWTLYPGWISYSCVSESCCLLVLLRSGG